MYPALKIIECPRDAMQGIHEFIPTEQKILYLNSLLQCGFDTLDFGSFVSPKAIPQMIDSASVLDGLILNNTRTKLLAIIANEKGAKRACYFEQIDEKLRTNTCLIPPLEHDQSFPKVLFSDEVTPLRISH